jgi:hypothetical protein
MDWEYTGDENEEPQHDRKPRARDLVPQGERVVVNERTSRKRQNKRSTPEVVIIDEKEDEEPKKSNSKSLKRRGVRLMVVEGPHKGESVVLEVGDTETLMIGSKPSSKIGSTLALKKDKAIESNHVQLTLNVGKFTAVLLTDKSKGKTYKNFDVVKTSTKAFLNDTIRIGNSGISIIEL